MNLFIRFVLQTFAGKKMEIFIQVVMNGLMLGFLYAIISIGLTLIFGIVKVVNFAHGEFLMLGMYLTYVLSTSLGIHPYMTILVVVPILFIVGVLTQRLLIQPLMNAKDNHIQIFATVGLSTALINLALLVFSADIRQTPASGLRIPLDFGVFTVLKGQLVVIFVSILVVILLELFLRNSRTGRAIRAVGQNRAAAQLMGINVNWIFMLTFGLGSVCVGIAAVFIAPLFPVSPTTGINFVLIAFVVVVLGGLGSLGGAFVGALIVGLVDSISGFYLGSDIKQAIVFGIFLILLILKPSGLFSKTQTLSHVSP